MHNGYHTTQIMTDGAKKFTNQIRRLVFRLGTIPTEWGLDLSRTSRKVPEAKH